MSKDHEVRVDDGKFTFIAPADHPTVRVVDRIEPGEPWVYYVDKALAVLAMMRELDAARVVVQAARCAPECSARVAAALALHDRLTSDREPPSAWCGVEQPAAVPQSSAATTDDPPISLDDLERRATRDAQRLDGLHGDPSRAGGWIGHRDYARALVLLIPRLRRAEAVPTEPQSADRDRAMLRAFMAMPTAATLEDLNDMRAEIDDARLGPADRAEVKRVYERRKALLETQAAGPCSTCGKPGCQPMEHAGWDPNRDR